MGEGGLAVLTEYKGAIKQLVLFLLLIVGIRVSGGLGVLALALVGLLSMGRGKIGATLICFMHVSFLMQINSTIIGGAAHFGLAARVTQMVLVFAILIQAMLRKGNDSLPLGLLYVYLGVAVVSSMQGYFPLISYLKIVNFLIFIMAIHVGTWNLRQKQQEIKTLRDGLLAFSIFIVAGSALTYPFPSIGYSMMIQKERMYGNQLGGEDIIHNAMASGQVMLFSGVTNHSQTLSPVVVAIFMWLICDMIFVEKRMSKVHMGLLALCPVLAAMTRSRLALLGLATTGAITCFYILPKIHGAGRMRRRITNAFLGILVLMMALAVVMEIKSQFVSKWMRKTNDVERSAENKTIGEAFTATRQGTIEENMRDFMRNPLLGSGFQVAESHPAAYQMGRISIFSAPIEKGLLPLMVLGETGIVGGVVFAAFLISFLAVCGRKRYVATASGMMLLFMLNMGEAMFFSPGGQGGAVWVLLIVGGFAVDIHAKIGARLR